MTGLSRPGALAYGLAIFVVLADQAMKVFVVTVMGLGRLDVVPLTGPIALRLVWNQGISFGLFRYDLPWTRWALAAFSFAVAVGLGVWARRIEKTLTGVAVGLVMGGAVGNLIDRVRLGAVADFVDATALHFPWVFNLADSAISVGIALLVLESLFLSRKA